MTVEPVVYLAHNSKHSKTERCFPVSGKRPAGIIQKVPEGGGDRARWRKGPSQRAGCQLPQGGAEQSHYPGHGQQRGPGCGWGSTPCQRARRVGRSCLGFAPSSRALPEAEGPTPPTRSWQPGPQGPTGDGKWLSAAHAAQGRQPDRPTPSRGTGFWGRWEGTGRGQRWARSRRGTDF